MAASPLNLSALAPITTTATALSNLILVSPQSTIGYQPLNPPNPDGTPSTAQPPPAFLFNYEGEQSATLESDITDHFIEDNTALQDQIALKPIIISTQGFIGELNDIAPPALAAVKAIANKLTIISAYTPALSTSALIAYNTAFQLYQVGQNAVNSAVAAWSSINGTGGTSVISGNSNFPIASEPNQNKQQLAFQQLFGYWNARTLLTVQTPWAIFQNMTIKSMRPVQEADQAYITTFEMSFKQLRFAQSTTLGGTIGTNQQGRATANAAGVENNGTTTPVQSTNLGHQLIASGF
jgi:hypothetical protein